MEVVPTPDQELGWRLANVESRLDAISERLGRLELSLVDAVSGEVHEATAELRRAISELGRRLVQDSPAELARHRDAIIADLRPPPPPPVVDVPSPAPEPGTEPEAEVATTADTPEAAERRRASRLRRRQG